MNEICVKNDAIHHHHHQSIRNPLQKIHVNIMEFLCYPRSKKNTIGLKHTHTHDECQLMIIFILNKNYMKIFIIVIVQSILCECFSKKKIRKKKISMKQYLSSKKKFLSPLFKNTLILIFFLKVFLIWKFIFLI